jgi:hypothetical protein
VVETPQRSGQGWFCPPRKYIRPTVVLGSIGGTLETDEEIGRRKSDAVQFFGCRVNTCDKPAYRDFSTVLSKQMGNETHSHGAQDTFPGIPLAGFMTVLSKQVRKQDALSGKGEAVMYDIEQLVNAQMAVYVMASPDGSDCEFLVLSPRASDAELEALRARWAGRDLHGAGVAYLAAGIPRLVLKEEPSDFMMIVRLTAAYARYVDRSANDRTEQPCADDSVMFCELLYALQDPRSHA